MPSAHLRTIPCLYTCKNLGSSNKSQICWNNSYLRCVIVLTDVGWPKACMYQSWKLSGSYKLDVRTATRSKKGVSYWWNIGSMMHGRLRWFCMVILWLIAKEQVDWPKDPNHPRCVESDETMSTATACSYWGPDSGRSPHLLQGRSPSWKFSE